MAEGRWVNIPGKGRRWQQPSGELMMTKPGFGQGEFFQTRASQLLGGIGNLLRPLAGPASAGVDFEQYASPAGRATSQNALLGRVPAPGSDSGWWRQSTASSGAASSSAGTSSSPAERAYQQEVSRVAQMAAQNPELQRYEAARLKAVAPGATPEQVQSAEDIGMRIWAEKYGKTLAPKVKPGQAGYDVIQGVLNAGAMGEPLDLPFSPASPLGDKALESIPTYEGASDLQPVGTPLPRTQFDTPRNQAQAQMFNRFLQSQAQVSSIAPPVNPAEATYVGATNVQPIAAGGDVALNAFSFNTPAEQRRAALFDKVIFDKLFNQAMSR